MATKIHRLIAKIRPVIKAWVEDTRGNIMTMTAIALPVLIGMTGLAIEGSSWYQMSRAMQNAADAAAIAAASNATTQSDDEAKAVARQYGFTHGVNNASVIQQGFVACPTGITGGAICFEVTISKKMPELFSNLVGFDGGSRITSTTTNGGQSTTTSQKAVEFTSRAIAVSSTVTREYCVLALSENSSSVSYEAFGSNGAPNANLTGCGVMSNGSMDCNGHNLQADFGDAHGTNSGCGVQQNSNVPKVTDPYEGLAANIPNNTCSSYPQVTWHNNGRSITGYGSVPAVNRWTGNKTWTGYQQFCGDVVLTGNVTLSGTETVLVIQNGLMYTNGFSITTASGAAATIVYSGTTGSSYKHTPFGTGTINIQAPPATSTSPWKGVAMYTAKHLTDGVNFSEAGNNPTWNITGLIYMPRAVVEFKGAVNKSSNGHSCFVLVADTIQISGTANILSRGQCDQAGLVRPQTLIAGRGRLVS